MAARRCKFCGRVLPKKPLHQRGRFRVYCSPSHRQSAYMRRRLIAQANVVYTPILDAGTAA